MASQVDAEYQIVQIDRATHADGTGVQQRPAPLGRIIRGSGDQVSHQRLLDVREPLVSDRHGDRVGGDAPQGVVRPIDRVEDEGRLAASIDISRLLAEHVQRGSLIIEDAQDRLFGHSVDAGTRGPIGAATEDLGRISFEGGHRVLDRIREFQEETLHRPTYRLS